jgi:anaerobic magnesium-protoporphyrin IX monomethyl ester cyclase
MRVLFINPPWVVHRRTNLWRRIASVMPPLGIAWLAAVVEKKGHRVKILDAHAEGITVREIPQWVRDNGPFDLVGITATTPLITTAMETVRAVKSNFPSCRVVLGGVHPTVLPEEALSDPAVDAVVRGEGELTVSDIAAEKPFDDIQGISYRKDGTIVHNPDRKLIADLDTLPFPAYHLLPMSKYRPAAGAARRTPATSVLATRGCPGRCTFCYRIFGHHLRVRSGRKVAEEVKMLQEQYGIKEVCFYDDTFTAVRREVREFCLGIQDLRLDLTWSCFSRIDTFDEDTFRIMKESGCHQVMFGVETGNREILKNINKRQDPDAVEGVIRSCQRLGLDVRAAFMLGNPGETEESIRENIRYAVHLAPDLALFNIATPYPGTEMFEWAERNDFLRTKNWDEYDLSAPILELPTISSERVLHYYKVAHRSFLLRPGFIWKRLKKLHRAEELRSMIRGLRMLLGMRG